MASRPRGSARSRQQAGVSAAACSRQGERRDSNPRPPGTQPAGRCHALERAVLSITVPPGLARYGLKQTRVVPVLIDGIEELKAIHRCGLFARYLRLVTMGHSPTGGNADAPAGTTAATTITPRQTPSTSIRRCTAQLRLPLRSAVPAFRPVFYAPDSSVVKEPRGAPGRRRRRCPCDRLRQVHDRARRRPRPGARTSAWRSKPGWLAVLQRSSRNLLECGKCSWVVIQSLNSSVTGSKSSTRLKAPATYSASCMPWRVTTLGFTGTGAMTSAQPDSRKRLQKAHCVGG